MVNGMLLPIHSFIGSSIGIGGAMDERIKNWYESYFRGIKLRWFNGELQSIISSPNRWFPCHNQRFWIGKYVKS